MRANKYLRELAVDTKDTALEETVRVGVDVGEVPVVGDDGSLGGSGGQGQEGETLDRSNHLHLLCVVFCGL